MEAICIVCGSDINLCISGGEEYHIGASALAVPRPSLSDENNWSASASVMCVTGHKEDELARESALRLSSFFHCRVNVTAGIHVNKASSQDIELILKNYHVVIDKVVEGILEYKNFK